MRKEYFKPEMAFVGFSEDVVRTSSGSDEGRGLGLDYFAVDDFNLYTY